MAGRPPFLKLPKRLEVWIEYEIYEVLRELKEETGVSIGEMVREAIQHWLEKKGLVVLKEQKTENDNREIVDELRERLNLQVLRSIVREAEQAYNELKKYDGKGKDLHYYDAKQFFEKKVRKAVSACRAVRNPPKEILQKLLNLVGAL